MQTLDDYYVEIFLVPNKVFYILCVIWQNLKIGLRWTEATDSCRLGFSAGQKLFFFSNAGVNAGKISIHIFNCNAINFKQ